MTPTAGRRVLIVEDSEDMREMLKELIELSGHEVHAAADGLAGVARVAEHAPDLVLVDVGLPGIDGYEVARRVRAMPDGHVPYLVALTGHAGQQAVEQALDAGFDEHCTKPLGARALRKILDGPRRA